MKRTMTIIKITEVVVVELAEETTEIPREVDSEMAVVEEEEMTTITPTVADKKEGRQGAMVARGGTIKKRLIRLMRRETILKISKLR
jgi:hypothetical protein